MTRKQANKQVEQFVHRCATTESEPPVVGSAIGSAAARYEVKSLSSGDYYICLRGTDTPVAKILRGTLNEELLDLKRIFDGSMPPNVRLNDGEDLNQTTRP